jgi:histidinol-phosphate aminotransferase
MFDLNVLLRDQIQMQLAASSNEGIQAIGSSILEMQVKEKIAAVKGIAPDSIFVERGKNKLLDLFLIAFCEPEKDNIIIFPPNETIYETCAQNHLVEIKKAPLTQAFQPDLDRLQELVDDHTKIIFFSSPHILTGTTIDREAIEIVLNNFEGLVVVDEALINYSRYKSFLPDLVDYPNLVVFQTFSEAWNLAHLNIDMAFAWPDLIQVLNILKPEANIDFSTHHKLSEALATIDVVNANIKETVRLREALRQELAKCSAVKKVYVSDTNFIWVETEQTDFIFDTLKKAGIYVSIYNEETCKNHIRISVGTAEEHEKTIEILSFAN